jgi:AcrR family transcriptional regulator
LGPTSGIVSDDALAAGRREERKARNRAKLLAGARKVFAEKGVGAASARDIVRQTDLATGTFYNYFDRKEDIFAALLEELFEKTRASVREQRQARDRSVEERVEGAYRVYFELVVEERELFDVIRRNAGAISTKPEEELFEAGVGELIADLREWTKAGELPPVDLELLATAMMGLGFQVAAHLVDRDPPDPEAAARFCTTLVLRGLRGFGGGNGRAARRRDGGAGQKRVSGSGRARGRAPR